MKKGDKNRRKILAERSQIAVTVVSEGEYTGQLRGYSEFGFFIYATSGSGGSLAYAIQKIQAQFDDIADCYETKMEDQLTLVVSFCVEQ